MTSQSATRPLDNGTVQLHAVLGALRRPDHACSVPRFRTRSRRRAPALNHLSVASIARQPAEWTGRSPASLLVAGACFGDQTVELLELLAARDARFGSRSTFPRGSSTVVSWRAATFDEMSGVGFGKTVESTVSPSMGMAP